MDKAGCRVACTRLKTRPTGLIIETEVYVKESKADTDAKPEAMSAGFLDNVVCSMIITECKAVFIPNCV